MNSFTLNKIINNAKEFCLTHARPPTDLELARLSGLAKVTVRVMKHYIRGTGQEKYFNGMKNGYLSHD